MSNNTDAKDFTYLADKAPSELHEVLAAFASKESGVEITAKQVQVVLGIHPYFQKSKANKSRSEYKPLDETIVQKRSEHMTQAHVEARELQAKAKAAAEEAAAKKANAKPAPRRTRKPAATK